MPPSPGILYIVATPIGNLEDVTYRAIRVLSTVDYLAAEDTRRTKKLLNTYGIAARLVSYHDHNKARQAGRIVSDLQAGKSVALVCDAGTPGISDPGYLLINAAIETLIPVVPIPGASAAIAALSASGLPTDRFVFEGYLPRKKGRRRTHLQSFREEERTIIIYESPHRIMAVLGDVLDICGDRHIVIARELTKLHEEIFRGLLSKLLKDWSGKTVKGEITVLIASAHHTARINASIAVPEHLS